MIALLYPIFRIYVRRATGTSNCPGLRPYVLVAILMTMAAIIALLSWRAYVDGHDPSALKEINVAVAVCAAFATSGLIVLATEAARDKTGAMLRSLESMPISPSHVRWLLIMPLGAFGVVGQTFVLIPMWVGMVANGFSIVDGLGYSTVSIIAGTGLGLFCNGCTLIVMRSKRWDSIRMPSSFILWAVSTAAVIAASVDSFRSFELWHRLLTIPSTVKDVWEGSSLQPMGLFTSLALLTLGILTYVAGVNLQSTNSAYKSLRLTWTAPVDRSQFAAEAIYALRDTNVLSTTLATLVINVLLIFGWKSFAPSSLKPLGFSVVIVVTVVAGLAARVTRGVFMARFPPAAVLGLRLLSWFGTQCMLNLGVFLLAWLPALWAADLVPADRWLEVSLSAAVCLATAVLLNFTVVVSATNPIGQILATWLYAVVASLAVSVISQLVTNQLPDVAVFFAVAAIAAAVLVSFVIERRRWRT
ncbi:hypothetical protein ACIPWF_10655 [Paenarthrobacter sp. NPDC089989]|uniref:hypothetical protein n=1 Tax=unclassified Paenarthrobacter TaxID=2634190 RepID=UPI0037F1BF0B